MCLTAYRLEYEYDIFVPGLAQLSLNVNKPTIISKGMT